jgi:hypothetical protein
MELNLIIFMFIKQISFFKLIIWLVFTFHSDMKPRDTKRQVTTPKKIKKTWLNQFFNIHILRINPTNRWVDVKTTHQVDGCTQNLHMAIR